MRHFKRPFGAGISAVLGAVFALSAAAQYDADGVSLLSQIDLGTFNADSGNDCWGYVSPSGREYALMGLSNKIAFVEITDPQNPDWFFTIPHSSTTWADVKVFEDHAYIVTEGGSGIQIADMSDIDNHDVVWVNTINSPSSSHNVAINTQSGFLYTAGSSGGAARTHILDLNQSKTNPPLVGTWETYEHDMQVLTYTSGPNAGREIMLGASEGRGLDIVDVTDKQNPVLLSRTPYPTVSYCHQVWTEDGRYVYINDELDSLQRTSVFDISDLSDPQFVTDYNNGHAGTDHNCYVRDGYLYAANYKTGLRIFDLSDPENPTEVGYFDTHPESDGPGFEGAWSTFAFFPSGVVLVSDINRGLFVLDPTEVLEGRLAFSYPAGTPEILNPSGGTTVQVQVTELGQAIHQPGSGELHVDTGGGFQSFPMSDLGGNVYLATFPGAPCGQVVRWYVSAETTAGTVHTDPAAAPATTHATLAVGGFETRFEDDFNSDMGWTVTNINVSGGAWERAVPSGDGDRGDPPVDYDGSGFCYVTGDGPGNTDVDGGPTILTSPVLDLSGVADPQMAFAVWMNTDDGDDFLVIEVSNNNGGSWVQVDSLGTTLGWQEYSFRVQDHVMPTAQTRMRLSVADNPNNSVTEAGLDAFTVRTFICDSIEVVDFDVIFGTLVSGGLTELLNPDDQYLVIRSSFGFSAQEPNIVELLIGAEASNAGIPAFDIVIEGKLNNPGGNAQVRVKNWSSGAFEQVDQFPIGSQEITRLIDNVNAANRVRQSDGRIEASVRASVIATFSATGFEASVDQLTVTLN